MYLQCAFYEQTILFGLFEPFFIKSHKLSVIEKDVIVELIDNKMMYHQAARQFGINDNTYQHRQYCQINTSHL